MLRVGTQAADWYTDQDPDGSIAFIKSCGFDTIDFNLHDYVRKLKEQDWEVPYTSFFDKSLDELYVYFTPLKDIEYRGAICFETFKTLRAAPKAVWPEILKLGAAIGHHWSDIILE